MNGRDWLLLLGLSVVTLAVFFVIVIVVLKKLQKRDESKLAVNGSHTGGVNVYDITPFIVRTENIGVINVETAIRTSAKLLSTDVNAITEIVRTVLQSTRLADVLTEIVFSGSRGESNQLDDFVVGEIEPVVMSALEERGVAKVGAPTYLTVRMSCRVVEDLRPADEPSPVPA